MDIKENYSILLVDDDPIIVRILRSILSGFTPLRFATSGKDALVLARKARPDLVLMDVEMPGMSGFDLCSAFKADKALAAVPIIFVTSHNSIELETAGLRLGAVDFITKPPHAELVLARVRAQMGTKRLSDTLRTAVTLDFLTGTSNRVNFDKVLQTEWNRSWRSSTALSLVLIELNDYATYAAAGDEEVAEALLREVAEELRKIAHRPADLLARYASGTFAILLPETDAAGAMTVAQRALEAVARLPAFLTAFAVGRLTVSVGIGCAAARPNVGAARGDSAESGAVEGLIAAAESAVQAARRTDRTQPAMQVISRDLRGD